MMYRMPPDIVAGLAGTDLTALGIPSEADYLADYCRRTQRPQVSEQEYGFYIAFNFFRLAAIFHGIKGRFARGTAASANAMQRVASFPKLASLARENMDACR
jgi:aminoglycoside phosphotransferase (APT) family kinase protein